MQPTPHPALTPETLLRAYAMGIFPMAESRDAAEVGWVDPLRRGVFPLDGFHVSRSLARALTRPDHSVTTDADFAGVLDGCADRARPGSTPRSGRSTSRCTGPVMPIRSRSATRRGRSSEASMA